MFISQGFMTDLVEKCSVLRGLPYRFTFQGFMTDLVEKMGCLTMITI